MKPFKGKYIIVFFVILTATLLVLWFFGSTLSNSDSFEDEESGEQISDEKIMLQKLENDEISEDDLDAMYFSREEFKKILKKVDDSKKLVSNVITYEYYFEEWTVIDYNEDGEEIWGWKKGFHKDHKLVTNEFFEKPNRVDWQPIYVLAAMASMYQYDNWTYAVDDNENWHVEERIDEKSLDNAIRVFNYEYNYLWDGARTQKTFYTWAELEGICYRYEETGDWDRDEFPVGEYHLRTCKKIPESCVSNICNALIQYDYQFCKNTHCTPRYQYPDNWEVDYKILDVDPDIFTRACTLVAPNFEWKWFLDMLETLPGVEDKLDEETGELKKGIYSYWKEVYENYLEGKTANEEMHDIPEKGIIVGEELTELLNSFEYSLEPYDGEELAWPLEEYSRISSDYGYRWHPILGVWKKHDGVDIAAPMGTPIYAALPGRVTVSTYSKTAGNYVVLDHGNGLKTLYMHASELDVQVGQIVNKGDTIAKVGSTGRSTGPHLHFAVNLNGGYVNPWTYLGGEP